MYELIDCFCVIWPGIKHQVQALSTMLMRRGWRSTAPPLCIFVIADSHHLCASISPLLSLTGFTLSVCLSLWISCGLRAPLYPLLSRDAVCPQHTHTHTHTNMHTHNQLSVSGTAMIRISTTSLWGQIGRDGANNRDVSCVCVLCQSVFVYIGLLHVYPHYRPTFFYMHV